MKTKKIKWPKYRRRFPVPIYGGMIYLFDTQEAFFQAASFLKGEPELSEGRYNGNATHFVNSVTGESIYLIGWYNNQLSTLVHEITHVGIFIMTHVGINPVSDGGEAMSYLNGYLFEQISHQLRTCASGA